MTQPTSKRLVTEDKQTTAISNHAAATDPHGDRAYALTQITAAIDALKAGVPGAYDTLVEIADKLGADDDALAGLLTAVDDKVDQADLDTQTAALIGAGGDTDDALSATYVAGRACSTDGTNSLPDPTGDGLEFVITATGLDDIRFGGVSL